MKIAEQGLKKLLTFKQFNFPEKKKKNWKDLEIITEYFSWSPVAKIYQSIRT